MLLSRSILSKICLLVALRLVRSENYDAEYAVDEGDDHSDFTDDGGHVDYSKYFSVDGPQPLITPHEDGGKVSGFVNPAEFYSFFSPGAIDFGESNKKNSIVPPKNPFVAESKTLGFIDVKAEFPQFFSASGAGDFFEEAQKKEQSQIQEEKEEATPDVRPGPNYISTKLPSKSRKVKEEVDEKPKKKSSKYKADYEPIDYDNKEYKEYNIDIDDNQYKSPDYTYDYPKYTNYEIGKSSSTVSQYPKAPGLVADKSFIKSLEPTLSPYQKYSFQPITENSDFKPKYLKTLLSTAAPFNPAYSKIINTEAPIFETQPSEIIPSNLKGCSKITKQVPSEDYASGKVKTENMDCYVCEDPNTSSKFTQCSYNNKPESQNYYAGESQRYSVPAKAPTGFRYKRYSGNEDDPYEYIKSRSQSEYKKHQDEDHDSYNYDPEYYSESVEKSASEQQAEELLKKPGSCQKVDRNGMTCTVCKNPDTGGNYEQCSYTSEPQSKKYAYVKEHKYDSLDDQPEETKSVEKTQDDSNKRLQGRSKSKSGKARIDSDRNKESSEDYIKKIHYSKRPDVLSEIKNRNSRRGEETRNIRNEKPLEESKNKKSSSDEHEDFKLDESSFEKSLYEDPYGYDVHKDFKENQEQEKTAASSPTKNKETKKSVSEDPYDIPQHFAQTINEPRAKGLYGNSESQEAESKENTKKSDTDFEKEIEEYHYKLFPEFENEESRHSETPVTGYPPHLQGQPEEDKKDVEEVLAEFVKKDRTDCKRAEKKGMTCYLCVDKKGIQHEECMYVSESKPKATHVAYHELKQLKSPNNAESESQSKEIQAVPEASEKKQKIVSTKSPLELIAAASEEIESYVEYPKPTKPSKKKTKKYNDNHKKGPKASASNDYYDIDSEYEKISRPDKPKKKSKKESKSEEESEEKEPEREADSYEIEDESEKLNDENEEPTQKTPAEFEVGETEGAFSDETKPVYSKALGITLPRYMLDKSEFEKEFDAFASAG